MGTNYILNTKADGHITLTDDYNFDKSIPSLYKFIWSLDNGLEIMVDHIPTKLMKNEIICLTPLHNTTIDTKDRGRYLIVGFNPNFYCIYGHDNEVSCNGFLFYGSFEPMRLSLTEQQSEQINDIIRIFKQEITVEDNLQEEMLRIILKRLIINCTRIARKRFGTREEEIKRFDIARQFHILVDQNFKTKKQVKDYAEMLNRSPKTLSNMFAEMNLPSPIKIIHERIEAEAKRLLLNTSISAKEIADMLGFEDSASFSRFFKKMTEQSATEFRSRSFSQREEKEILPTS